MKLKKEKLLTYLILLFIITINNCQSKNPFYGIDGEDKSGPDIYVDYPPPGSLITSTFTIIGRAKDKGGDNTVLKIEISLDNGNTWNLAGGTTNWSYTIDPFSSWGILSNQIRNILIKATDTDYKRNTNTITVSYIVNNTNPDLLGSIKDSNDTIKYDGTAGYDGYHNSAEGNTIKYVWDNIPGAQGYEMTLYNITDNLSAIVSIDTPTPGSPIDCSAALAPTGVSNASFDFDGTKLSLQFEGVNGKKYYLAVKPYDISLQRGPVQISISETIDTVPPNPVTNLRVNGEIDTDPNYFNTRNITFSWNHASDLHTGIRYYKIDVNNDGTYDITVDGSVNNYTYTYSSDGAYTARVISIDMAGNVSVPTTISFTIDTANPPVIAAINDNGTIYLTRKVIRNNHQPDGLKVVKYTWADIADARYYIVRVNETVNGKYDEYTIDKNLGSGTLANGTNTGITSVNWSLSGGALTFYFTGTDGRKYYIGVKPVDNANNVGNETTSNLVWVDTVLPTAGSVTDPGNYINSTSITFSWSGFIDGETGIEKYYVASSDDGTNWSADQDLGLATSVTTSGYGTETFDNGENARLRGKAIDYVGNESSWAISNGIIVDTTPPTFTIINTPVTDTYTNTGPVSFTGFNGSDTNFRYYEYMIIDNGVAGAIQTTALGNTNPTIIIGVPVTNHTYKIIARAIDLAGNTSGWVTSNSITYDTTLPPAPTSILVDNSSTTLYYNTSKNINISWSSVTDFSGIQYYQIDINNDGVPDGGNETGTSATRNLAVENIYQIRVRAVDNASNIGNWSIPITVQIDMTQPNDITGLSGSYTAPNVNFTWDVGSDNTGGSGIKQYVIQYNISPDGGTNWLGWSPDIITTVTNYSFDASGLSTGYSVKIKVKVEDNAGNRSVNWVESLQVDIP
ncbi:MAG TPA: hypothetical protein PKW55_03605 [Spirochaetota bacterium]|nr:hypothetical protein [Spirochaetota bacterium]HOM38078.1 hypothetical protein [Spirochaetota bacterium]HPQ48881.1 hypothetical protein [Spirochaetota bacterium]